MGEVFVIHVQYSMSILYTIPCLVMLGYYPCIMCQMSDNFDLFTKLCNIRVILIFILTADQQSLV